VCGSTESPLGHSIAPAFTGVPPGARAAVAHAARAGTASGLNTVLLAAAAFAALGAIAGFAFGPDPSGQPPPRAALGELPAQRLAPSIRPSDPAGCATTPHLVPYGTRCEVG
jgi:hypothetical protein